MLKYRSQTGFALEIMYIFEQLRPEMQQAK